MDCGGLDLDTAGNTPEGGDCVAGATSSGHRHPLERCIVCGQAPAEDRTSLECRVLSGHREGRRETGR